MREVVEVEVEDVPGEPFPGDAWPRPGIGRPHMPPPHQPVPIDDPAPLTTPDPTPLNPTPPTPTSLNPTPPTPTSPNPTPPTPTSLNPTPRLAVPTRPAPPLSDPLPASPVPEVTGRPGGGTADGFEVNPAVITGAGGVFDAEATALVDGGHTAAARLASLGACWGDDRVGARFGTTYQPAAERTLHNVAALGAGLARIAAALRAVGTSYESVDDGIAAAVDAYARRLEAGTGAGTADLEGRHP